MLKSYIKVAFRNMYRQKAYSFINILGLAIGMAISLLIFLWVLDEFSYDKFNENYDNIHLVFEKQHYSDQKVFSVSATPFPLSPALKEEYPEIIRSTRFDQYTGQNTNFKFGANSFSENIVFVDPDFLKMFTFKLSKGTLENALDAPNSIVLTESMAKKYFGDENPVGKVMKADGRFDFIVTAVLDNVPSNSSLDFELLGSFKFLESIEFNLSTWGNNSTTTYIQLNKNANADLVSSKIRDRVKEHQAGIATELFLHPLSKLHLYNRDGINSPGRIQNVIIFSIIAIFILIIASINFINLSTARATKRFKEVGLKKVIGATRSQVARQFFSESIILALLGLFFALIIVFLLLPEFNFITGKELTISYFSFNFYLIITTITLFVGLTSGVYPSLYLSKFQPVEILNERGKGRASSSALRTILVVFQFSISAILILATVVIYKQTEFMLNKDLGYSKKGIVYVNVTGEMRDKIDVLKDQIRTLSSVKEVGSGLHLPSYITWNGGGWGWDGKAPETDPLVSVTYNDNNWWKVFDLKLLSGRGFDDEIENLNSQKIMVNESFAKMIQSDGEVVGKILTRGNNNFTIIGVVSDFDFLNMRREVGPLAIFNSPNNQFMFIKINSPNANSIIPELKNTIENTVAGVSPTITFFEDYLDKRFVSEQREKTLAGYFALLTIIIASLGLVGLSSFIAEQKTKEIGIRKILGAAVSAIVSKMSLNFIKNILIANLIGLPLGYYLMNKWLEDYPYRIGIGFDLLMVVFIASIAIALLSTIYQSVKAALVNPVKSLRYE